MRYRDALSKTNAIFELTFELFQITFTKYSPNVKLIITGRHNGQSQLYQRHKRDEMTGRLVGRPVGRPEWVHRSRKGVSGREGG